MSTTPQSTTDTKALPHANKSPYAGGRGRLCLAGAFQEKSADVPAIPAALGAAKSMSETSTIPSS
jgi:hypothetical protein